MMSGRILIDVLPMRPRRSHTDEGAFVRAQYAEAARDVTLRAAVGMEPLSERNRRVAALRRANQRRRAEAA